MANRSLSVAFLSLALCASSALAAEAPALPPSSAIAARIDLARAKSLPATQQAIALLFAEVPELRRAERMLTQSFGLDVQRDVSSIVAWSDGFTFSDGRVSLSESSSLAVGSFATAKMSAAVRRAKGFESAKAGSLEIMTGDFAKGRWLAFPGAGKVLASSSKGAAAKAASALAKDPESRKGFLASALADDCPAVAAIDGSKGGGNLTVFTGGLLKADADKVVAKVTEKTPGTARLEVEMTFADANLAAQTFATLNGIKMLIAFQQAKDPNAPAILQRIVEADVKCEDATVRFAISATAAEFAALAKSK